MKKQKPLTKLWKVLEKNLQCLKKNMQTQSLFLKNYLKIKDDIKKELNNNSHLYSIPEINEINHMIREDNEDEKINTIKELKSLKKQLSSSNNEDSNYSLK